MPAAIRLAARRMDRAPGAVGGDAHHEEWLTTSQASALVGVSSATLRRWCDAGAVTAFTTPGGHRRLARSAVLGLLPDATSSPSATAPDDRQACLRDAESAAAEHDRVAAAHGCPMGETVELFLQARDPFLREIAALSRRGALDATQATELMEAAIAALDRSLLAVIGGHRRASAPGGRSLARGDQARSAPRGLNG